VPAPGVLAVRQATPVPTGVTGLRERVSALPGMDRLLPALDGLEPTFLVGGAVRDLLLDKPVVDLDLVVEGDARWEAQQLASRLDGTAIEHDHFGTATVRARGLSVDLASARRERYSRPGALPSVEPAPLLEDLTRRDFTINTMAIALTGEQLGRMHDPRGGYRDLRDRLVRVLHTRSFIDDPTRLLRALRYEARLDFAMDTDTEALARQAGARGAVATVSGSRVRDGLRLLLTEDNFPAALSRMRELELDHALHPALTVDPALAASAALGAVETGANRLMASLAVLVLAAPDPLLRWLDDLNLPAEVRQRVTRAVLQAPAVAQSLSPQLSNSALHDLLQGAPAEVLALALALGAPGEPVLRYARTVSVMRLEIDGTDLLAAGVPQSPALGAALHGTLRRKLDGLVSGRDEELRTAVELARSLT